jgi:hypothetical protein
MFGRISIFGRVADGLVVSMLLLLGVTSASAHGLNKSTIGVGNSVKVPEVAFMLVLTTQRVGVIDFRASEGSKFLTVSSSAIMLVNGDELNWAKAKIAWQENPLWCSNGTQFGKLSSTLYEKTLARSTINVRLVAAGRASPVG